MAADPAFEKLVADVAAAYVSNANVSPGDIPRVLEQIAASLSKVGRDVASDEAKGTEAASPRLTAAQIRKSITPDALISFEDGKRYKTLKRHLSSRGLSPQQYRDKWGLPRDYPMVAPGYAAIRSQLAKSLGLGRKRLQAETTAAAPDLAASSAISRVGQNAETAPAASTPPSLEQTDVSSAAEAALVTTEPPKVRLMGRLKLFDRR